MLPRKAVQLDIRTNEIFLSGYNFADPPFVRHRAQSYVHLAGEIRLRSNGVRK